MVAMHDDDGQVGNYTNFDDLVMTMENMLVQNKELHHKMLALMKEKENNDMRVIKIVNKFKETISSQIKKTGKIDGNDVRLASNNVANATRNVLNDFVTPVLKRTAGLKHAFEFFGKAITPPSLDGVGYDKGAECTDPEESNLDNSKTKIIEDDSMIYDNEKNDESILAEVMNSDEKENTLDISYRSKDLRSNCVVDMKDGSIETMIDGGNKANDHSSQTSLKTKIIVEDMKDLDDDMHGILTRDSSKKVAFTNRLLIKPSDSFGNSINRDLTPGYLSKEVETSTPLGCTGNEGQVPGVFVFSSAQKSDIADTDDDVAEQSILSLMTFEEKKVYFAQKIKEEEASAMKGNSVPPPKVITKSPQPSSNALFPRVPLSPSNNLKTNSLEEALNHQLKDKISCPYPDVYEHKVSNQSLNYSNVTTPNEAPSGITLSEGPEGYVEESEGQKELLPSKEETIARKKLEQEVMIRTL